MSENQSNFEALRRLLALKRHETPPMGYFGAFSSRVIARIRAGEAETSVSLLERLLDRIPRLLKSLQILETKPVFVGGYASALCLLLVVGVIFAERPESAPQVSWQPTPEAVPSFTSVTPAALPQPVNPMLIADSSTNPVFNFQPVSSPLGQTPPGMLPVNYSLPGN